MRKAAFILAVLSFWPCAIFPAEKDPIRELEGRVVEHSLKNGMKILILERHAAPLVSFQMMFRTGGVDEVSGKTGLAHLFEHMLFKGSKTVGTKDYGKEKVVLGKIDRLARQIMAERRKMRKADPEKIKTLEEKMVNLEREHHGLIVPSEFDTIYQREGAQGLNAFTGRDMTGFVVDLPSNKWELWPIMESDRMANPVLRGFYKEKDVVMEERRMRYENAPRGKIWENFNALAFIAHRYGSPTIGWMSDIRYLSQSDAEKFFKAHYVPNNAVVAIVGDVDAPEVIDKLEKYFSRIPAQELPGEPDTMEPPQEGERRGIVHFDSGPQLLMGFHKPNPPHPDNSVMDMIELLLSRGRTSRFYRNILEKKVAISAWASNGNPGERYPNMIVFGGSPKKPNTNRDLEKSILKELARLKSENVRPRELEKIRNQVEADFIRGLESNKGMASQLAYYQTVIGDWRYLFQYLEGIGKVTPKEVMRVAKKYFENDNKTVVYLQRPRKK